MGTLISSRILVIMLGDCIVLLGVWVGVDNMLNPLG